MSRRPALVTQADVARTLRAIRQEDHDAVVEIAPDGTIRIIPAHLAALPKAALPGDITPPIDDDEPFEL